MRTVDARRGRARARLGFTLAEMLIVVAIIAVLLAIAIPSFTKQLEMSRESTDLQTVRAAYNEVLACAQTDDDEATYNGALIRQSENAYKAVVSPLSQEIDGWTLNIANEVIGDAKATDSVHWQKVPEGHGACTITIAYDETTKEMETTIIWGTGFVLAPTFDTASMYGGNGHRDSSFNSEDQKAIRRAAKQALLDVNNATRKANDNLILEAIAQYFVGKNLNTDTELQETFGYEYEHNLNSLKNGRTNTLFGYQTNADNEINVFQLNGVPNYFASIGYTPLIASASSGGSGLTSFYNWKSNGGTGPNYVNQYLFQSNELVGDELGKGVTNYVKYRLKVDGDGIIQGITVFVDGLADEFTATAGSMG